MKLLRMRVIACLALTIAVGSAVPVGTDEQQYTEDTRAYEKETGMVCEIHKSFGKFERTCKTTLESMRDMLEELRIEREAETGLKCEIDKEKFEVECSVHGDDYEESAAARLANLQQLKEEQEASTGMRCDIHAAANELKCFSRSDVELKKHIKKINNLEGTLRKINKGFKNATDHHSKNATKHTPVANHTLGSTDHLLDTPEQHPLDTPEHPLGTNDYPLDTTEHPLDTTDYPLDTTEHPLDTTEKPLDTTEKPLDTTTHPLDTTEKPLDTTEKPVDTTNQPLETTNQPLETTNRPLATTNFPLDTTESYYYVDPTDPDYPQDSTDSPKADAEY